MGGKIPRPRFGVVGREILKGQLSGKTTAFLRGARLSAIAIAERKRLFGSMPDRYIVRLMRAARGKIAWENDPAAIMEFVRAETEAPGITAFRQTMRLLRGRREEILADLSRLKKKNVPDSDPQVAELTKMLDGITDEIGRTVVERSNATLETARRRVAVGIATPKERIALMNAQLGRKLDELFALEARRAPKEEKKALEAQIAALRLGIYKIKKREGID